MEWVILGRLDVGILCPNNFATVIWLKLKNIVYE